MLVNTLENEVHYCEYVLDLFLPGSLGNDVYL